MSGNDKTLLVKNALVIATMDDQRQEIADGAIFVRGNVIEAIGQTAELPNTADEVIDCAGHAVLPGLINTHHHMVQSLTRAVPAAQNGELFDWLQALYPIWGRLTPDMVQAAARTAMAELLLSGCTTTSDHFYIFPNGCRVDDTIAAASELGIRFHPTRGSMSLGKSAGGLPPDHVVEREDMILRDTMRVIETYNQPERFGMVRVGVAPCSPFTVSLDLMRESAALARSYGVRLHTHLAENDSDVAYSLERFGCTPAEFAEDCGWVGADVWHAHCVKLDETGIDLFARTGTGIAHCPCSNMRLASGIAPIRPMLDRGVRIGLGVDGTASNDTGHMLAEARQAMLLQRVGFGPSAMSAREALELGTRGGAAVLGRDDIGHLSVGMAADFIAIDMQTIGFAGALHDPVAALVFCTPPVVAHSVIDGRIVVRDGQLTRAELPLIVERHNRLARELVHGA